MSTATNVRFFYQAGVTSSPHVNYMLGIEPLPLAGRLLVLGERFSQSHDWFLVRHDNLAAILGDTTTQVRRAIRQLLATGLFRLGEDGRLWRVYLPGETPDDFARRCRRAPHADSRVVVYWTLAILGDENGVVRHSVAQLAAETGLNPSTVRRAVIDLELAGALERSEVGCGRGKRSEYVLAAADPRLRDDKMSRIPKGAQSGAKVRNLARDPPKGGYS